MRKLAVLIRERQLIEKPNVTSRDNHSGDGLIVDQGDSLLFIVVYSLMPQTERVNTGFPGGIEHVLAYSLTGLLLGLSIRIKKGPFLAATHLTWLSCLLEFLQQWSPGRHPRISDAIISAAAGTLGAAGGCMAA